MIEKLINRLESIEGNKNAYAVIYGEEATILLNKLREGKEMAEERREKQAVIRLDDCGGCPHFRFNLHGTVPDVCMAEERELPDDVGIPEWCPLEDWNDAAKG